MVNSRKDNYFHVGTNILSNDRRTVDLASFQPYSQPEFLITSYSLTDEIHV